MKVKIYGASIDVPRHLVQLIMQLGLASLARVYPLRTEHAGLELLYQQVEAAKAKEKEQREQARQVRDGEW